MTRVVAHIVAFSMCTYCTCRENTKDQLLSQSNCQYIFESIHQGNNALVKKINIRAMMHISIGLWSKTD